MAEQESHRLRHAIIVAGPSGSGKTILMRQLAAGQLAAEIRERLPAGADGWLQVHGNRFPAWLPAIMQAHRGQNAPGIVLHYDITREGLAYVNDYRRDPALRIVWLAARVTFVHLRPAAARLIRQWGRAKMGAETRWDLNRRRITGGIADVVGAAVRAVPIWPVRYRGAVLGRIEKLRVRSPKTLALYLRPGGVDSLFLAWDHFMDSLRAEGLDLTEIHIAPDAAAPVGQACRWRVIERAGDKA